MSILINEILVLNYFYFFTEYLTCSSKYVTMAKNTLKRVQSKNYPSNYPKNYSCTWNLKVCKFYTYTLHYNDRSCMINE